MNRRRVLLGFTAGIPLLAGCSTPFSTNESSTQTQSPTTVTETARTTATQTTTSAATATPPSAADAWSTETATEDAPDFDLSTRETYPNERYAYTIEYPVGWTIDDTDPSAVDISTEGGLLMVNIMEDIPSSLSLDETVSKFLEGYKESIEEDGSSVEELDRQDRTLSNGHEGKMIDLRMRTTANVFQEKVLLTVVNEVGYVALTLVPDEIYSSDVEASAEEMLLTLTISESTEETDSPGVTV